MGKGKRITAQLSKRRMKIVSVYKTLAQRLRSRSGVAGEQVMEETTSYAEEMGIPPQDMGGPPGRPGRGPPPSSGIRFEEAVRSAQNARRNQDQDGGRVQESGRVDQPESSVGMESSYLQSPQAVDSPKPVK